MRRKVSNLNQMYGFVYQHKNGKLNRKRKALLPHSFCWKPAVGSPLKQTLNSSSPSASAKSLWLKNNVEKHFKVPQPLRKFKLLQIISNPEKQSPLRSQARPPLLVLKLQHLQCIVAAFSSGEPSVSTPNTIESKEAIKIPSCRKKPLRRVDARRQLANMKRSPAPHCSSVTAEAHTTAIQRRAGTASILLFLVFAARQQPLMWD